MWGPLVRIAWVYLRPCIGWGFILLGIAGFLLPVLQGVLFMAIGIALLGRRNRVLRWFRVRWKLVLRRWSVVRTPIIGAAGRLVRRAHYQVSRQQHRLVCRFVDCVNR